MDSDQDERIVVSEEKQLKELAKLKKKKVNRDSLPPLYLRIFS